MATKIILPRILNLLSVQIGCRPAEYFLPRLAARYFSTQADAIKIRASEYAKGLKMSIPIFKRSAPCHLGTKVYSPFHGNGRALGLEST